MTRFPPWSLTDVDLDRLVEVVSTGRSRLDRLERWARFSRGRLRFVPRADDIWVVTYPRSGTTWMSYMLHLRLARPSTFDHINEVCPWFERALALGTHRAEDFAVMQGPRIFKSHLLPRWTPRAGRFVYIRRDPLDMARSYFSLYRNYLGFEGSLDDFVDCIARGEVQYGDWAGHTRSWLHESERSVLAVEYEDLRTDPEATLRRLSTFLGLPPDDAAVAAACEGSSLAAMRADQTKFDHATALLRERGIRPGEFVGTGRVSAPRSDLDHLRDRLRHATPGHRVPGLHLFLR